MIPDEAVEAAAKVMYERKDTETTFGEVARAALEAAAPYIVARAFRDAADQLEFGNPINGWLYDQADEMEGKA